MSHGSGHEAPEYARADGRTDDAGYIRRHGMHEEEVRGVLLLSHMLDHPGRVGNRGDSCRAQERIDLYLQKEVHEDMDDNFSKYPKIWDLSHTDKNIDHRRVPNLMVFFSRHGKVKPLSTTASHYKTGDIVCWNLSGGITHIGIVVDKRSEDGLRPMIVHNIGDGQVLEDCLFEFKIIGHYSYR